ncbi:DNA double-strand break repair Rad50 ATPase, putative [Entamoeba invadens IP1]|uniref:DNA double-strand break repair Rad50 ATPase, putative n=1 Tax=Entamoeba invadens IP1 TaxID=370355 RepID=A0A0A1U6L8_ENTIV|nr:DNA double-strand break repair Rad50 ATPase, putative [Entamoeba invadens IP1]ELP90042.1 DNA double-strand break repair Rad50 ATPase, putative [Entamoeba invadens IP1]|eukprot:XP_004256813.1 DNA double-strand break repair Rad50 ATPase, putative [Entamoeba invadens IP1]
MSFIPDRTKSTPVARPTKKTSQYNTDAQIFIPQKPHQSKKINQPKALKVGPVEPSLPQNEGLDVNGHFITPSATPSKSDMVDFVPEVKSASIPHEKFVINPSTLKTNAHIFVPKKKTVEKEKTENGGCEMDTFKMNSKPYVPKRKKQQEVEHEKEKVEEEVIETQTKPEEKIPQKEEKVVEKVEEKLEEKIEEEQHQEEDEWTQVEVGGKKRKINEKVENEKKQKAKERRKRQEEKERKEKELQKLQELKEKEEQEALAIIEAQKAQKEKEEQEEKEKLAKELEIKQKANALQKSSTEIPQPTVIEKVFEKYEPPKLPKSDEHDEKPLAQVQSEKLPIKKNSSDEYVAPNRSISTLPKIVEKKYSINEMKSLRGKQERARDSVYEIFQRFVKSEVKKEEKKIQVDKTTAFYKLSFNQLTKEKLEKIANDMVFQIRTKEDSAMMLQILFKKSINEQKYVHLYVKFFIRITQLMETMENKKEISEVMIISLLNLAEAQFKHPPVPRKPVEGETAMDQVQREELNAIDEVEYVGTVYLVSYLYIEGRVLPTLVLQCLNTLSSIGGKLPLKAYKTLVKETCTKLSKQVDLKGVITMTENMMKVPTITFMEKVWLEESVSQLKTAMKAAELQKDKQDKKETKVKPPKSAQPKTGKLCVEKFVSGKCNAAELCKYVIQLSEEEVGKGIEEAMNTMDETYNKDLESVICSGDFIKGIGNKWKNVLSTMKKYMMNEKDGLALFGAVLGKIYCNGFIAMSVIIEMIKEIEMESFNVVGKIRSHLFVFTVFLETVVGDKSFDLHQMQNNLSEITKDTEVLFGKDLLEKVYHASIVIACNSEDGVYEGREQITLEKSTILIPLVTKGVALKVLSTLMNLDERSKAVKKEIESNLSK